MKLTTFPLVAALSGLAAAASTGNVYIHDPSTSTSATERRTLTPTTARLVLAQRVGAEDYHIDGSPSEEEVDAINTYGSKTPLFGQDERQRRAFLLLVGEAESEGTLPHSDPGLDLRTDSTPSAIEALELFWSPPGPSL
jgi:hypothetical protein